uniref:AD domain-containing protein n=1 Tax=Wuchereria bancrofti TaxID=6293 RepID=A0A1I8EA89_WUCBA
MTIFNTRSAITTTITTPESMSEESSSSLARQLSSAHAAVGEAASSNVLDSNVVFPVGSVLECRNVLNSTTVGQVICSDQPTRLLVLRDTSGPGKVPLVRIVNLALVAQVTCLKDKGGEQSLPWPNLQISTKQVQERMNRAIARKKASIMQTNVSLEGQRAFIHLRKTLEHRVEWSGNNIKVLNRVLIHPPYTADSIEPIGDVSDTAVALAREHVRKILTKYRSTQQTTTPSDDAPADPTPSH